MPCSPELALAPLSLEHVTDRYIAWLNDPEVVRWTEVGVGQTRADVELYVHANVEDKTSALWRIMYGNEHVGNVRLSGISPKHQRAEVALLVGERTVWGRGVGSLTVRCLAEHAFVHMGIHRLQAGIYAGNIGSVRAFEKAGFHLEGRRKDYARLDGERVDCLLYAKLAVDVG